MALPAWALLTMEEAQEAIAVSGSSESVLLESLVGAASLRCETECARKLMTRTHSNEIHNGTGSWVMRLREFPVTSVTTVEFLTADVPATWTAQSTSDYPVTIVEPVKDVIAYRNLSFPWGVQNVRVTYVAGLSAVAEDLKAACRMVLLDLWKQKDRQLAGIASQSFGGQTTTYLNDPIPVLAARLLDPYRRMAA